MAIQGSQNLSGITFNAQITNRAGNYDAFGNLIDPSEFGDLPDSITTINYYDSNNVYNVSGGNILNVEDFGAVRNGESTAGIQAAINYASTGHLRQTVYFPGHRYYITGGLTTPVKQGLRLQGQGITASDTTILGTGDAFVGAGTVIIRSGEFTEPMITVNGFGLISDGIMFAGKDTSSTSVSNAPVGMLITKTAGIGVGKTYFPTLGFHYCDTAIQCAPRTGLNMGNIDNLIFGFLGFWECGTGFELNNIYCIGTHIEYLKMARYNTSGNLTVVRAAAGGNFFINGGSIISGPLNPESFTRRVFYFPSGAVSGIGHNAGSFGARNLKFDAQAFPSQIVKNENSFPGIIRLENIDIGHNGATDYSGYPFVDIVGQVKLTMSINKLFHGMIKMTQQGGLLPNVKVHDSRAWNTFTGMNQLINTGSVGVGYWRTENCSNYQGVPFRDTGNYLL